jgi:predicted N-acetyltransferase YhbS
MGAGIKTPIAVDPRADHADMVPAPPRGSGISNSASAKRRIRANVVFGTRAEHVALRSFLARAFGPGYHARFQAELEDPHYAPCDRLLLVRSGRIIAHAHVTRRNMQFGPFSLPVAALDGLAIEDDFRGQGLGSHLLTAAERKMAQSGALVGILRTRAPYFFRRTGWAACGGNFCGAANPHQILARLLEQGLGLRRTARIQVRPWRRWEEEAIARVYRQNLASSFGLLERNRNYWHWLLEQRAYDHFYVALDGPDLWDLKETSTRVVGYAAIRGEKIIELMTVPGRKKVVMELLARACGDAIEQDQRQIVLHGPANCPAQEYFHCPPDPAHFVHCVKAGVCMARILDPLGLLRKLCCLFTQRATEAGLARPVELGLLVDGRKYQIDIAGSGRATADTLGRSYLRLNVADFTRLVLGQLDWDRAVAEGRVVPSTALAHDAARVLFPRLPYWRPRLDDLLA